MTTETGLGSYKLKLLLKSIQAFWFCLNYAVLACNKA